MPSSSFSSRSPKYLFTDSSALVTGQSDNDSPIRREDERGDLWRRVVAGVLIGVSVAAGSLGVGAVVNRRLGRPGAGIGKIDWPGLGDGKVETDRSTFDDGSQHQIKVIVVAPKGREVTQDEIDQIARTVGNTRTAFSDDTGMRIRMVNPDNSYYSLNYTAEEMAEKPDEFGDRVLNTVQRIANDRAGTTDPANTKYLAYYLGEGNGKLAGQAFSGGNAGFIIASDANWSDPSFDDPAFVRYSAAHTTIHEVLHQLVGDLVPCQRPLDGNPAHSRDGLDVLDPGGAADREVLRVDNGRDDYFLHGRADCPDAAQSPYFIAPEHVADAITHAGRTAVARGADLGDLQTSSYPVAGGYYQGYERGFIGWTPKHGAFVVEGGMYKEYQQLGGFEKLGLPVSQSMRTTVNGERGAAQQFERGVVVSTEGAMMINAALPFGIDLVR